MAGDVGGAQRGIADVPALTTPRLILRALSESDAVSLHRVWNDTDVTRYFPNTTPPSQENVQQVILRQLQHWKEYGYGWWAVELRAGNEMAGWCGLQYLPETDEAEVAYLLGKAFWGKGLATEGARASLRYGFDVVGLKSIVAIADTKNRASQRVAEKLGMAFTYRAQYFGMDCYRYEIDRASFDAMSATWWATREV